MSRPRVSGMLASNALRELWLFQPFRTILSGNMATPCPATLVENVRKGLLQGYHITYLALRR